MASKTAVSCMYCTNVNLPSLHPLSTLNRSYSTTLAYHKAENRSFHLSTLQHYNPPSINAQNMVWKITADHMFSPTFLLWFSLSPPPNQRFSVWDLQLQTSNLSLIRQPYKAPSNSLTCFHFFILYSIRKILKYVLREIFLRCSHYCSFTPNISGRGASIHL